MKIETKFQIGQEAYIVEKASKYSEPRIESLGVIDRIVINTFGIKYYTVTMYTCEKPRPESELLTKTEAEQLYRQELLKYADILIKRAKSK